MAGGVSGFRKLQMRSPKLQCGETSECVMACTVSATRFSTPTLRISLATCALTVRSLMPSGAPISLFDRPSTSIFKTCFSWSVKATWSAGKIRRGALPMRSMNIESTRRGAQTEPRLTIRIACTKSARIHVALGPGSDGRENGLFVHAGNVLPRAAFWNLLGCDNEKNLADARNKD